MWFRYPANPDGSGLRCMPLLVLMIVTSMGWFASKDSKESESWQRGFRLTDGKKKRDRLPGEGSGPAVVLSETGEGAVPLYMLQKRFASAWNDAAPQLPIKPGATPKKGDPPSRTPSQ